jgi:hypothetical protein
MIVFSANFFQPFFSKMIDTMPLKPYVSLWFAEQHSLLGNQIEKEDIDIVCKIKNQPFSPRMYDKWFLQ